MEQHTVCFPQAVFFCAAGRCYEKKRRDCMRKIMVLLMVFLLALPVSAVPVPILMYHHFTWEETGMPDHCSAGAFREHLAALSEAGYTSVTFKDLLAYADGIGELPEKPVLLTADDGYRSVVQIALPLLREYGMTMSAAVVGGRMGAEDGIPHFSMEEAAGTGLELVSHTWNLHGPGGDGVLNADGSLNPHFIADAARMRQMPELCQTVLVYPCGRWSNGSEAVAAAMGYRITVTTEHGIADIRRDEPESLRCLPRICMGDTSGIPFVDTNGQN